MAADVLDISNMTSYLRGFLRNAKGKAKIFGLHNYQDVNRKSTADTRAMLATVGGQVWLTETGGILTFLPSFPRNATRQANRTKWMFQLANRYDTRQRGLRSKITRLYNYDYTGVPAGRPLRRRPDEPQRLEAQGVQHVQEARRPASPGRGPARGFPDVTGGGDSGHFRCPPPHLPGAPPNANPTLDPGGRLRGDRHAHAGHRRGQHGALPHR